MTRHKRFVILLRETLKTIENKRAFPNERHNDLVEVLLISIAGSLALIADALNPAAAAEEQDED